MTPKQLLQECEQLTYNGRMRRMVELGQQAASDATIAETLAALAQGDVYQRVLATQACYGSRNSAHALQALSDPSRSVRSLALSLAIAICNDAELQTALNILPLDMKTILSRRLHQRHRYAPIDGHLETLAAQNNPDLKELLSFGSREAVIRYLGQTIEQLNQATLSRLARRYPDLVIASLRTRATISEIVDPRLILQVNALLPLFSQNMPDQALALVNTLLNVVPLSRLDLQPLLRIRPNEIADLLFQTSEQSTLRFDAVAHRLDTERLLTLFTRYSRNISTNCFAKLRSEQRLAIYTACERGWRDAEGILPYVIVSLLPTAQRLQEGRRHLELPALISRPQARLPYAAFLPWDEALAFLTPSLRSPDADLRGIALKSLITTTRYQRDHLAAVLQLVRQRRNEQDPVRREMLSALAALPHGIWQVAHLADLAQVIRDAFNASDLSPATAQAIERLVVYLFPFHAAWSAVQMTNLYRERGHISFFQLDSYLSESDVQRIAPLLTPILRSWQKRESEGLLVSLAQAMGKRLRVFAELADLLEATLNTTLSYGSANLILHLFLEHRRERAYQLIPTLLQKDKSFIFLSSIYTYLHRYRQDLLTPFLGQHAYKGRFSTGRTRFALPLQNGFHRWTPTQQEIFAHTLLEIIVQEKDQNRATYELISTIHRLALMPAINPSLIIQFARDERQLVREITLRALGILDAGQGIPTLLEALNDDRARIAIYVLRTAFLSMPRQEALNLLRTVPFTQVTVAKEVVRLIGDLSSEAAYRELLTLDSRDLHRDVRIALFRALWSYSERAETWEVFTRAAQSPEAAQARGVIHIPEDGMSPSAQRRLAALTSTLLIHPEAEVRIATLQWRTQHPVADENHILFTHLLSLMNSPIPDECTQSTSAVFSIYTGNDAPLVGNAIKVLLTNRRALQLAIETFTNALLWNREHLLPTTRAILSVLAEDPLTLTLRTNLLIWGLPWEEIAPELIKLAPMLHADALGKAHTAIQQTHTRPDAQLFALETALATHQDERLRRIALAALIAQSKQAKGWSDDCIARLQTYRADPSPLVAEAAQFTFVS